ncbi:MAG: hypothetical protein QNI91_08385 [Arenicellales bacterium]|nr:hypothetical protein [Arenicellales bacterium]
MAPNAVGVMLRIVKTLLLTQLFVIHAVNAQSGQMESSEWETVPIPEPLLFDMALPLGTKRGQVEVNSIFRIPTSDGKVISVPEVEGTIADGVGLELEIEFEDSTQTGWSTAAQFTLGRALAQQFIHGIQLVVERDDSEKTTDIVALYIPAYRFSPVWSTLLMVGLREPINREGETKFVFNGSVFATTTDRLTLGIELNLRADISRTDKLEFIPQIHWTATDQISVQAGVGIGKENDSTKSEAMLRAIYAF